MNNTFDLLLHAVDAYTCRECCNGKECGCFFILAASRTSSIWERGHWAHWCPAKPDEPIEISCGADSCGPKEPCVGWKCTLSPPGKYDWQSMRVGDATLCEIVAAYLTCVGLLITKLRNVYCWVCGWNFFLNRWIVGYKQERDCFVHFLRLLVVCWLGALSAWDNVSPVCNFAKSIFLNVSLTHSAINLS